MPVSSLDSLLLQKASCMRVVFFLSVIRVNNRNQRYALIGFFETFGVPAIDLGNGSKDYSLHSLGRSDPTKKDIQTYAYIIKLSLYQLSS